MRNNTTIIVQQRSSLDQISAGLFIGFIVTALVWGTYAAVKHVNYYSLAGGMLVWALAMFISYRKYRFSPLQVLKNSVYLVTMSFLLMAAGIVQEEFPSMRFDQDNLWLHRLAENALYCSFNIVPALYPVITGAIVLIAAYFHNKDTR